MFNCEEPHSLLKLTFKKLTPCVLFWLFLAFRFLYHLCAVALYYHRESIQLFVTLIWLQSFFPMKSSYFPRTVIEPQRCLLFKFKDIISFAFFIKNPEIIYLFRVKLNFNFSTEKMFDFVVINFDFLSIRSHLLLLLRGFSFSDYFISCLWFVY